MLIVGTAAILAAAAQATQVPPPIVISEPEKVPPSLALTLTENFPEIFAADPLSPTQEAQLPLARQVVAMMTPPGFYREPLRSQFQRFMRAAGDQPAGLIGLQNLVRQRTRQPGAIIRQLSEEELSKIAIILDPAAQQRATVMADGLNRMAVHAAAQVEPEIREGISRGFAAKFGGKELESLRSFVASPEGSSIARQLLLFSNDPHLLEAIVRTQRKFMEVPPQIVAETRAAVAKLPAPRRYGELSATERAEVAKLLGVTPQSLQSSMAAVE